jgi:folate-binding protein YgfZ
MQAEWKTFLVQQGAVLEDNSVISFGHPQEENRRVLGGNLICDLSHLGLVSASGEDAEAFLQSQFGNDIGLVNDQTSQLSAYSNPKGRMLAIFRVFLRDERYYLNLPTKLVPTLLKRLKMFVLRSNVSIADASDELGQLGIAGEQAAKRLESAIGEIPDRVSGQVQRGDLTIIRLPSETARFCIYGRHARLKSLWKTLAAVCTPVGQDPWALLDILAGIPTVYPRTSEAFIAQMTNLQLINGVSFKKGCYPGQEIVARMQYLGKLKKRMYRVHIGSDGEEPHCMPEPGMHLFAPHGASPENAGNLVDARPHPDGGFEALAVIPIELAEQNSLRLGSPTGPLVELRDLPYAFEEVS